MAPQADHQQNARSNSVPVVEDEYYQEDQPEEDNKVVDISGQINLRPSPQ